MSYCPKCGTKVEEGKSYCNNCGAAIIAPSTEQQSTQSQPGFEQPTYQRPTYQSTYQQPMLSNELPRASIVLGKVGFGLGLAALISGATLGWIVYGVVFSISLGIPGIICGAIGSKKAAEANMTNPKSKAGVTMSVIGICVSIIELIVFIGRIAAETGRVFYK